MSVRSQLDLFLGTNFSAQNANTASVLAQIGNIKLEANSLFDRDVPLGTVIGHIELVARLREQAAGLADETLHLEYHLLANAPAQFDTYITASRALQVQIDAVRQQAVPGLNDFFAANFIQLWESLSGISVAFFNAVVTSAGAAKGKLETAGSLLTDFRDAEGVGSMAAHIATLVTFSSGGLVDVCRDVYGFIKDDLPQLLGQVGTGSPDLALLASIGGKIASLNQRFNDINELAGGKAAFAALAPIFDAFEAFKAIQDRMEATRVLEELTGTEGLTALSRSLIADAKWAFWVESLSYMADLVGAARDFAASVGGPATGLLGYLVDAKTAVIDTLVQGTQSQWILKMDQFAELQGLVPLMADYQDIVGDALAALDQAMGSPWGDGIDVATPASQVLTLLPATAAFSGGLHATLADFAVAAYSDGLMAYDTTVAEADERLAGLFTPIVFSAAVTETLNDGPEEIFADGVYRNENAAVLLARCGDAAVLSFRGTNDLDDVYDDAVNMEPSWDLLAEAIAAFDALMASEGITRVFVTGHSLGGALAERYLATHPNANGVTYSGITFAAPGFNSGPLGPRHAQDNRLLNFENFLDPIADLIGTAGTTIHIDPRGTPSLDLGRHAKLLYQEAAHFIEEEIGGVALPAIASGEEILIAGVADGDDFVIGAGDDELVDWLAANPLAPNGYEFIASGDGNDTLGGVGANRHYGGTGDDLYIIDNALDMIFERAGAGTDTAVARFSGYVLAAEVESLRLDGSPDESLGGSGNALANQLIGDMGDNTLFGLAGDDTLAGGAGNDMLAGGEGDDVYDIAPLQGDDLIAEGQGGVDTIRIRDVVADQLTLRRGEGTNDLVIAIRASQDQAASLSTVTISGAFLSTLNIVESILLDDGTRIDLSQAALSLAGQVIYGTAGNDVLIGPDSNDTILGQGGADTLFGGGGHDRLETGAWNDRLFGGDGNDVLWGGGYAEAYRRFVGTWEFAYWQSLGYTIQAIWTPSPNGAYYTYAVDIPESYFEGGNNTLLGGSGEDTLRTGLGDDSLDGGDGADRIEDGDGNNTILGGAGNDVVVVRHASGRGDGLNLVDLGSGDDTLTIGLSGASTLIGGEGTDTLTYNRGDLLTGLVLDLATDATGTIQTLALAEGTTASGFETVAVTTGSGDDRIVFANLLTAGAQSWSAGAGTDTAVIEMGGFDSTVTLRDGALVASTPGLRPVNLTISGLEELDYRGGSGNDLVTHLLGPATLAGGAGHDRLESGSWHDSLIGGEGQDSLLGGGYAEPYRRFIGTWEFAYWQSQGLTIHTIRNPSPNGVYFTYAVDVPESYFDGGNNTLLGGVGDDTLRTGIGHDSLSGGDDNDTIIDGGGDNTISGGAGNDTITVLGVGDSVAILSGRWRDYASWQDSNGRLILQDVRGSSPDGTDTYSGVASFQFSNGTFAAAGLLNDAPTMAGRTVSVSELVAAGASLLTITAEDADIPLGDSLTYRIIDGNASGQFAIDSATGAIRLAAGAALDYEGQPSFALTVGVTDAGGAEATASVTISVIDENEFNPVFSSGSSVTIAENTAATAVIYQALAEDADTAFGPVVYSLEGPDAAAFVIDAATGAMRLAGPADAESRTSYAVDIRAVQGTTSATHRVTVAISDINDNAPLFQSSPIVNVAENTAAGTVIHHALATDADISFGAVTYALRGPDAAAFAINAATGALTLALSPDYEADRSYEIEIEARQGMTSAVQPVTVQITNLNEAPVARNDSGAQTGEDASAIFDVLANDSDPDSPSQAMSLQFISGRWSMPGQPESPLPLTIFSATSGARPAVLMTPSGAFDALSAGQTADVSLTYRVGDGQLWSAPATLTFTVSGATEVFHAISAGGVLSGSSHVDVMIGSQASDTLSGLAGSDTLRGDAGHDSLDGGAGADMLLGGSGLDRLSGGDGNDTVSGGLQRDWLDGGSGNDILTGGLIASDVFVFRTGSGQDQITDFEDPQGLAHLWRSLWYVMQDADDASGAATAVRRDRGDIIALDVDGISNFSDLLPFIQQQGAATVMVFGNGDQLTLLNTRANALDAGDFMFL